MDKLIKRNRVSSDEIQRLKNSYFSKRMNPFEVHQNKEKFQMFGQSYKHSHGLPGISRGKAINKRKETLGKEFKTRHKVNKFVDRRMGFDLEDEAPNIRFSLLQQKKLKNKIFNLNNEEILTHKGQTFEEVKKFRNERWDESETDEPLDENFTKINFGGEKDFLNLDRKTTIENMVNEAKQRKVEILKDKVDVFQMTAQLDESYKNILPQLGKLNANNSEHVFKLEVDDYDKIMRKMIFEPRGEVSDRIKSKEETVKHKKQRNEKLEYERLERMQGHKNENYKPKLISADDLHNGFFEKKISENQILPYDTNEKNKLKQLENLVELEDNEFKEQKLYVLKQNLTINTSNNSKSIANLNCSYLNNEIRMNCQLTPTFEIFLTLLERKDPKTQGYIVQKLIENNHPKLHASNRQKIAQIFKYALRFLTLEFRKCDNIKTSFRTLDHIIPHLYDIIKINSNESREYFLKIIKKHYELYKRNVKKVPNIETIFIFKIISNLYSTSDFNHPIVTPSVIFINKILSESYFKSRKDIALGLFLTTLMLEFTNLSKRFLPACFNFLLTILKLAIPKKSVKVFKTVQPFQCLAEATGSSLLFLIENNGTYCEKKLNALDLISNNDIDNSFKILSLNTVFELVSEYTNISLNDGSKYIVEQFLKLMERLNLENYPDFVKQSYVKAKHNLNLMLNTRLSRITAPEKKPKALRLLEPKIEEVSDARRRPKICEEKRMRAIMIHKVKRESKGAEREIRRDTQFLNKIRIKQQIQSDLERKEKVKRIFTEASVQQGELNALKRQKD